MRLTGGGSLLLPNPLSWYGGSALVVWAEKSEALITLAPAHDVVLYQEKISGCCPCPQLSAQLLE